MSGVRAEAHGRQGGHRSSVPSPFRSSRRGWQTRGQAPDAVYRADQDKPQRLGRRRPSSSTASGAVAGHRLGHVCGPGHDTVGVARAGVAVAGWSWAVSRPARPRPLAGRLDRLPRAGAHTSGTGVQGRHGPRPAAGPATSTPRRPTAVGSGPDFRSGSGQGSFKVMVTLGGLASSWPTLSVARAVILYVPAGNATVE